MAIVLMGLSGFVFADLNRGSVKVPVVMDDSGKEVSFDYTETGADQASSGTCATNPSEGNS
ncbi:MAG: hypothetical protein LBI18_07445, partial [Planctomycetaceae bacterium]|nr:hypothetical protein [Planctomycetaceae bacterium]